MFDLFNLKAKKEALFKEIAESETKLNSLKEQVSKAEKIAEETSKSTKELTEKFAAMENRFNAIQTLEDTGYIFEPAQNSSELESERVKIQEDMVKAAGNGLWKITTPYTFNGSDRRGKEVQKVYGDGLTYALEAYIVSKEKTVTIYNLSKKKEEIINKFNYCERKAEKMGIHLNNAYIRMRIAMVEIKCKIKEAKKIEKAQIRQEQARLREEIKLLEESEKERKRLEDEKKAMDIAFAKALSETERIEIQAQIDAIDKRLADVDYRIANKKAGWLYVISSPALEGMVKIGTTRRLNPTVRVKELSSSSMPFPFCSHGFVFSDNCFGLENGIHKRLDAYRVNPDKEFFYIEPKEAIKILKDEFGCKVHFEIEEENDDEDSI